MLYRGSGDLKHLYRGVQKIMPIFPYIHLGLECIAIFVFMTFPRKLSQIVVKFAQETDNNILFAIGKP
jgi:hypothetical protein